jgi:Pyruvate/2-oxoacid:ferredoxin oxidoreductase delta subunit
VAIRKIIQIDEELCDGCGDCVKACHEGAIQLVNGKAKLVSDVYCDGLGDCVGECHVGAIKIIEREAVGYDDDAVQKRLTDIGRKPAASPFPQFGHHTDGGCPGSAMRNLTQQSQPRPVAHGMQATQPPLLGHWPVQLMLVPPHAPFLKGADLLVCADCVPFAVPDFHYRYLSGRAVVVGCPKLDDLGHYYQKLEEMFKVAEPNSITVLRMEVPCCGGIAQAAIQAAQKVVPETALEIHTVGISGGIQVDTIVGNAASQAG